jgi:hypothetical protein
MDQSDIPFEIKAGIRRLMLFSSVLFMILSAPIVYEKMVDDKQRIRQQNPSVELLRPQPYVLLHQFEQQGRP